MAKKKGNQKGGKGRKQGKRKKEKVVLIPLKNANAPRSKQNKPRKAVARIRGQKELNSVVDLQRPWYSSEPWIRDMLTKSGGQTRFWKIGRTIGGESTVIVKMFAMMPVNRYGGTYVSGTWISDGPNAASTWTSDFGANTINASPTAASNVGSYWQTGLAGANGAPIEMRQMQIIQPSLFSKLNSTTNNGTSPYAQIFQRVRLRGFVFIWKPYGGQNTNGIVYGYMDYAGLTQAAPTGATYNTTFPSTLLQASSKDGMYAGAFTVPMEWYWDPQDTVDMDFVPVGGSIADSSGTAASFVGTFRNQGPVHQFMLGFDGVVNWPTSINTLKTSGAANVTGATTVGILEYHALLEFTSFQ